MTLTHTVATDATPLRVAIAGNPNVGKTTLFNALTGAHQKVANYPGTTVEKRVGHYRDGDLAIALVDLPGTYSLGGQSPEERVAEEALLAGDVDVTVVVADSTTLSRSLVLAVHVMMTGANPVLCLNMADEARAAGQRLDLDRMRELLGIPVVEVVGRTGEGIDTLRAAIREARANPRPGGRLVLGEHLDRALDSVAQVLASDARVPQPRWTAHRLLLGHAPTEDAVRALGEPGARAIQRAGVLRRFIESQVGVDLPLYAAERQFGFVDGLLREVTRSRSRADARAVSDSVDRILAHRVAGLPLFLAAMYGVFWLTFTVGEIPMAGIEWVFARAGDAVNAAWPRDFAPAIQSLIVDGVLAGVGGVLVFLPNILLLFLGLAILEDSGYMARAAFLVDRFMHRVGLHGKSFLPMMTGFGCTIPGVMATRTLESERDRLTTMLVLPLMSCGARLPIWMLLIPAFFPAPMRAPALWGIYLLGAILAVVLARVLRSTILKGEQAPFVMELPPYRMPTARGLLTKAWERGWIYVRKAGTIILALSIALWFLTSYPKADHAAIDAREAAGALDASQAGAERAAADLAHSFAGHIGRFIEPVLAPLGFDWKLGTAMVGTFAAKELFVAQMGIVHALGATDEESTPLRDALAREYPPHTGFALMVFLLVGTPCMATLAVVRRESGAWKWALLQWGGLTALAWILALVVFQAGSLLA